MYTINKRVVASLTTMPDKYDKLPRTLNCLINQTRKLDAIYLGLPYKSRRLGIEYPELPAEVKKLCTVVRCNDYGPITKILAGLLSEQNAETIIITFDDDMAYPENIVEKLCEQNDKYPNSAIGSSGMLLKYSCPMCAITPNENYWAYRIPKFKIPPEGRRVDSIYGYPGALYVRKFFPSIDRLESDFLSYALHDNNMLMNDDIVISGYLSLNNVERRIFTDMPEVGFVLNDNKRVRTSSEISYNLDSFFQRMNLAIEKSKELGMYSYTEPLDISESIIGVSSVIVLSVILIIFLLAIFIYLIMKYR